MTAPRETTDGKPLGVRTARKHVGRLTQVCDAAHRWWTDAAWHARLAVMPLRPRMERGEGRKRAVEAHEETLICNAIQHHSDHELAGGDWTNFGHLVRFAIEHGVRREEALFCGPDSLTAMRDPDTGKMLQAVRLKDW